MLDVHEIFSSIQGEGHLQGVPMTFIRLWGCNLQCPFCDTPQTPEDCHKTTVRAITAAAYALDNKWVCITGGEPTMQPAFDVLVASLYVAGGLKVAIETNGTQRFDSLPDWICVSPKVIWPLAGALARAHEVKLLVGSEMYDAEDAIGDVRSHVCRDCVISLQPVWSEYKYITDQNIKRAIELCHKYQIRLSVQLHKYIGVK